MAKYGLNEHWRARGQAYEKLPETVLERFFAVVVALAEMICPRKKERGRPLVIGPAEAAFLAVMREYHNSSFAVTILPP